MKKKFTLFSVALFFSVLCGTAFGQAVLLNDNYSLSGIPFDDFIILGSDRDSTIWRSDGTAIGTVQISPVKSNQGGSGILNEVVYFAGISAEGIELWRTDGTTAGTMLVSDIWDGGDSEPDDFVTFNNKLYFTAYTPTYGRELYVYTGTGTPARLTDLNPNAGNSFNEPVYFENNNKLYFTATTGSANSIYFIEGSAIKQLFTIPAGYKVADFSNIGSTVIFAINNSISNTVLYKTTGTPASTEVLQDFTSSISGMIYPQFTQVGNNIYFIAGTDSLGAELYITDGSGVSLVADINPGEDWSYPQLFNAVVLGGKLVFAANTQDEGTELWMTDGTPGGTSLLIDINPNPGQGSDPFLMPVFMYQTFLTGGYIDRSITFNGDIFFFANDGVHGSELWKTDGTLGGTVMVTDLNPGAGDGVDDVAFLYTKTGLVFSGDNGTDGFEPWITDGTSAGTRMLADINTSGSSYPQPAFIWKGDIYLTADNGNGGAPGYEDFYKLTGPYAPLPIELAQFTATAQNDVVNLKWSTATENNSGEFVVMRSTDGTNFSAIGRVAAAGYSATTLDYSYIDKDAGISGSRILYYQLDMKDRDGRSKKSKIVSVTLQPQSQVFSVYPNPVNDVLKVNYSVKIRSLITITDLNGKTVYNSFVQPAERGTHSIRVADYPRGAYILKVQEGASVRTEKFVKR